MILVGAARFEHRTDRTALSGIAITNIAALKAQSFAPADSLVLQKER